MAVAECSGPRWAAPVLIMTWGRGGGMVHADGSNPSVRKDAGVRLPSPALSSDSASLVNVDDDS